MPDITPPIPDANPNQTLDVYDIERQLAAEVRQADPNNRRAHGVLAALGVPNIISKLNKDALIIDGKFVGYPSEHVETAYHAFLANLKTAIEVVNKDPNYREFAAKKIQDLDLPQPIKDAAITNHRNLADFVETAPRVFPKNANFELPDILRLAPYFGGLQVQVVSGDTPPPHAIPLLPMRKDVQEIKPH